jgi:long-subunit fatty acid transport protein
LKTHLSWLVFAVCTSTAFSAFAGGFYVGVKGARATGRGGAFTARADDLSAAALNPAGLARGDGWLLHVGNRFSYNAHIFERADTLDYTQNNTMPPVVSFAPVRNQTPWQLLDPIVGVAADFGLEDLRFAWVSYAPSGVSRQEFPIDGGQRYMMVKMEAMLIHHTANFAYSFSDDFALGASLQWITVPQIDYELVIDGNQFGGVVNPVRSDLDMLATVSGADMFTPNAVLGAWYRASPAIELGLSGQVIPADIETDSTLSIDPLSPEITDDITLRRGTQLADDVKLRIPLPVSARAGVRYISVGADGSESFDVELDLGYQVWSRAQRFSLIGNGLEAELFGRRVPVDRIGVEKHWEDNISVHLGSDINVAPEAFTVRGGVFFETAVAPPEYANVDALVGQQMGGALGASLYFGDLEIALAHEFRQFSEYSVSEADGEVYQQVPGSSCPAPYTDPAFCHPVQVAGQQPAPTVNGGTYRAYVHATSLDVLYHF